jgi:hypothetical protein
MRITKEFPMKYAARLNIDPLSFRLKKARSLKIVEFKPTCTIKKEIRKNPVSAITIFLPTAEVKKKDHFIFEKGGFEKFSAKVSPDD